MSDAAQTTALQVAHRVRDGMWARDKACQALGMRVVDVTPGRATLAMTVREEMLNGHDLCHGGYITTLADSAFAYACNSYDELTVASGLTIDFLAPARLGETLTASAHEVSKAGRTGVYDVEVSSQNGVRIAVFRGRSHTFRGRPAVPQASA
jgi:acyl-CoA thioesterase